MAKPPIAPITKDGIGVNYFDILVDEVKQYLGNKKINLNFEGYKETIQSYSQLKSENTDNAWEIARDLNMWAEYFVDLSNLIQKMFLDSETDKIQIIAVVSTENDVRNVSNGERLANKDARVVAIRKERNTLKAFYTELEAKVQFLERAYYHCKSTCEWNNQSKNKG